LTALVAGTVLAAGLVAGIARADDAKSVIAYRENVMKSMAAHITQIAMVAKGEVSFAAHVVANAQAIANAAKVIPEVFPKGTTEAEAGVESEAKAEIWNEWDKFTAAAKNLETQATKLAEVAAGGDAAAVGAQLGEVGKACGGCHEPFRKKKPE
jgi:cytochrome c556